MLGGRVHRVTVIELDLVNDTARVDMKSDRYCPRRPLPVPLGSLQLSIGRGNVTTTITLRIVSLGPTLSHRLNSTYGRARAALVYGLTVGRFPLAVLTVVAFQREWGILAVAVLGAFVILDIFDGVIARSFGMETALRRGLDGVIDKASVHLVAAFVCMWLDGGLVVWLILIGRDLVQALLGGWLLVKLRVVAAGAKWHRWYTSAIAVWGGAALLFGQSIVPLAIVMIVLATWTLGDYIRQCRAYMATRELPSRRPLELESLHRGNGDR